MRTAALSMLFIAVAFSAVAVPVRQSHPVIASDGTSFLAIWSEGEYPTQALVASRISRTGQIVDAPPITIFDAPAQTYDVTFGGSDYLIVWTSGSSLLARRITPDAMFVDAQPIQIDAESPNAPAAAWNGSAFFVVWGEWHQGGGGGVFGATIATDGSVSSKRAIETSEPSDPQVAWSGNQFVVLWPSNGMCDGLCYSGGRGLHTVRIAADGSPIDTLAPLRFPDALNTALASNGTDSLVVYDGRSGETSVFIVSPNGDPLQTSEPRTVFRWFTPAWSGAAWDGQGYLVASRYGTVLAARGLGGRWWLAVTRIAPDGNAVSASGATTSPPDGTPPSIAANSLGEFVIVQAELIGDTPRVQIYVASQFEISPPLPPAPEIISAIFNGRSTTVTWRSDARDVEGYVVDEEPRTWMPLVVADRNARSAEVSLWRGALRVRAFSAAGISEASDAVSITSSRRRAASR